MGKMGVSLYVLLVLLLSCPNCKILVQSQDSAVSIYLACGSPGGKSYTDSSTNISYISDSNFIETGVVKSIDEDQRPHYPRKYWYVRSFPTGARNCYRLNLSRGRKYHIKAFFVFGNHFGLGDKWPQFHLYLGVNYWATVSNRYGNMPWIGKWEMVNLLTSDHLHVCLVRNGSTTPFISTLEVRQLLLKNTTYNTQNGSLSLFLRRDIGSASRYFPKFSDDSFGRPWESFNWKDWSRIKTTKTIKIETDYQPPQAVMRTASIPEDPDQEMIIVSVADADWVTQHDVYIHVAEIQEFKSNDLREFEVICNGKRLHGPFEPRYLTATTIYANTASVEPDGRGNYIFSMRKTKKSTLPPLLNAVEVYAVVLSSVAETDEREANAMANIKRTYVLRKVSWQGDPCAPIDYTWEGLNCSYSDKAPPRIKSLNLASSGLTGEIAPSISNLTHLESVDLSNNSLMGRVPEFLAKMASLRVINLTGNKLKGPVPASLLRKAKNGSLSLCFDGHQDLCPSDKGKKKKSGFLIHLVTVGGLVLVLLGASLAAFFIIKHTKRKNVQRVLNIPTRHSRPSEVTLNRDNRRFTYSEVSMMTNNFQRILGRGGFGVVYYGTLEGKQVAVKMLDQTSVQGYKQFKTEVDLLMRVHHKNLTSLVGYCNENEKLALIYDFMANGDLKEHLSGMVRIYPGAHGPKVLSWKARLQIASEAAQGLEYLHNGCRPPIVHRDVKTTNILLNENFQAKLSDFGLSRSVSIEGETHVSTVVAGTPGYLDPEYYQTNHLTEKSDVYGFGILLLEMVTNCPVIDKTRKKPLISEWVGMMLSKGDITSILDHKLQGDFDTNSVWKFMEIAMACANPSSSRRPTMTRVVMELNECLAIEVTRNQESHEATYRDDSLIEASLNLSTEIDPRVR